MHSSHVAPLLLQQANLDALCPKPDAGGERAQRDALSVVAKHLSEVTQLTGSLEARREKKAAVTSFARERDERHVAF